MHHRGYLILADRRSKWAAQETENEGKTMTLITLLPPKISILPLARDRARKVAAAAVEHFLEGLFGDPAWAQCDRLAYDQNVRESEHNRRGGPLTDAIYTFENEVERRMRVMLSGCGLLDEIRARVEEIYMTVETPSIVHELK